MSRQEESILFVMGLYNVSRETAISLYQDEIDAYQRILGRIEDELAPLEEAEEFARKRN